MTFQRMAVVTASTKRQGAVVAGLVGAMAVHIASLKCLPLDPLTEEVAAMVGIEDFAELLQTMVEGGLDILEGDQLIVGTATYKIRAVGQWYWSRTGLDTNQLILEEIK